MTVTGQKIFSFIYMLSHFQEKDFLQSIKFLNPDLVIECLEGGNRGGVLRQGWSLRPRVCRMSSRQGFEVRARSEKFKIICSVPRT